MAQPSLDGPALSVDGFGGGPRMRMLALLVGVLLIGGLVAVPFVGGGADSTDLETIVGAAEAVGRPGDGLTFESISSFTIGGQIGAGYVISGTTDDSGRADINIDFEGAPLPDYRVRSDGSTVVVEVPKENRGFADGRAWASAPIEPGDLRQFGDISRTGLARFLQGAADRTSTVGRETVRGVATTHHRVRVDPNAVFSEMIQAPTPGGVRPGIDMLTGELDLDVAPVDVWLDDDDRLRRMEVVVRFEGAFGRGQVSVRHDITSYDAEPTGVLPPAAEVFPAGSLDALLQLLVPHVGRGEEPVSGPEG